MTPGTETVGRLRVLYLMHVDWGWIRQRPHHMAEGLAARHDVQVLYPLSWRRWSLVRNDSVVIRRPLVQVPLRRRVGLAAAADRFFQRHAVRTVATRFSPDVLWVTHPRMEPLLPDPLPSHAVVAYDCMDDAAAFPDTALERRGIAEAEARLARVAAVTFASSDRLAGVLASRGFPESRIEVVRNAAGGGPAEPLPPRDRTPGTLLRAAYLGTVSSWLDFDALLRALEAVPELTVDLIGPREVSVPKHPRLNARGPVPHERLAAFAADADVLLVPFRRTPLVESVDPVKMYEYVAFGREVVCLRWPEVERFARFAHLYDSPAEMAAILSELARGTRRCLAAREERVDFLRRHSWDARVRQAEAALARACAHRGDAQ